MPAGQRRAVENRRGVGLAEEAADLLERVIVVPAGQRRAGENRRGVAVAEEATDLFERVIGVPAGPRRAAPRQRTKPLNITSRVFAEGWLRWMRSRPLR